MRRSPILSPGPRMIHGRADASRRTLHYPAAPCDMPYQQIKAALRLDMLRSPALSSTRIATGSRRGGNCIMIESQAAGLASYGEGARPAQATRRSSKSWFSTSTGVASETTPNVDQHPSNNDVLSTAGYWKSVQTVLTVSWLNLLLFVIPLAWASHWLVDTWGHVVTFLLCFIAIIPLQNIFDWCGDQVELHLQQYFHDSPHASRKPTDPENPDPSGNGGNTDQGVDYVKDLSDFLSVTFKNLVEVTLAAILLTHCHLRLLQSTIVGLVVLHLLFIPGVAFFVGGSRTLQQILHQHHQLLNPSLLMVGALGVMLPTAYFAALDHGAGADPVSDSTRDAMLKMSRGISVVLLLVSVFLLLLLPEKAQSPKRFHSTAVSSHTLAMFLHASTDTPLRGHLAGSGIAKEGYPRPRRRGAKTRTKRPRSIRSCAYY
ncbi:hypothetical protein C8Q77DRAFT_152398 [Trametes polyzona]|nr:hypothetical protein C8Q77DRAFT_152398 [Trametes polyzona]